MLVLLMALIVSSLPCGRSVHVEEYRGSFSLPTRSTARDNGDFDLDGTGMGEKDMCQNMTLLDTCKYVFVNPTNAKFFANLVERTNANFAFLQVDVRPNGNICFGKTEDVFLQNIWVWTFKGSGGAFPYLWYPHDFPKLSLSILRYRTIRRVIMTMDTTDHSMGPCRLTLGEENTTKIISDAFKDVIDRYFKKGQRLNAQTRSVFCYTLKNNKVCEEQGYFMYYITRVFGIEKWYTAYKCCSMSSKDPWNRTTQMNCGGHNIEHLSNWTWVLVLASVLCFLYSPLPITAYCNHWSLPVHTTSLNSGDYQTIPEDGALAEFNNESEKRWIYLGVDKPVTLSNQFCKPFSWLNSSPALASRLQRVVFFVIPSVVIGAKIAVYFTTWDEEPWIYERIKADIPVGFLAIPFGFSKSARNWSYMFGGPFIMYGIYFTIGLVLLLLPTDVGQLLTSTCQGQDSSGFSLLSLNQVSVAEWAWVKISSNHDYDKLNNIMRANFYMLLNRKFWSYAFSFCALRFQSLPFSAKIGRDWSCMIVLSVCLRIVFLLFYVVCCTLELVCCLLYYGLPAVFLLVTVTKAYIQWLNKTLHFSNLFTKFGVNCLAAVIIFYNMTAFAVLFISSTLFLIEVTDFTYIGISVYPYFTLGYVVGVGTLAYYFVGNIRHFNDTYSTLLALIVTASLKVQSRSDSNSLSMQDDAIAISGRNVSKITMIRVNGLTVELTTSQRKMLRQFYCITPVQTCVKWLNNQPGIPEELFYHVLKQHRPIRIEVFWFLFRLSIFCVIVASMITLQSDYTRGADLALPAHVFTLVCINVLPRIKALFISELDTRLTEDHLKRCIEVTVNRYWEERLMDEHDYQLNSVI